VFEEHARNSNRRPSESIFLARFNINLKVGQIGMALRVSAVVERGVGTTSGSNGGVEGSSCDSERCIPVLRTGIGAYKLHYGSCILFTCQGSGPLNEGDPGFCVKTMLFRTIAGHMLMGLFGFALVHVVTDIEQHSKC
jgi:hypothetical protein